MSKWLKLMKHIEVTQEVTPATVHSIQHDDINHSETLDMFQMMSIVIMLFAVFLTFKTMSNVKLSQNQTAQLVQNLDVQQKHILQLESELGHLKKIELTTLQSQINTGHEEMENLSLENTALKVRVKELEVSEQQMIDEMLSLTQDQAEEDVQITEGRNI